MATRRLRFALWRYHRRLNEQALGQESAAGHLVDLADALKAIGRPQAAEYLVRVALRLRVKAICLSAQANAVDWRKGQFIQRDRLEWELGG